MSKEPEIVYKATIGKLVCKIIKVGNKYVRQQTFSTGLVFEEDYTEEDYQDFLRRTANFNTRVAQEKSAEKGIKEDK